MKKGKYWLRRRRNNNQKLRILKEVV